MILRCQPLSYKKKHWIGDKSKIDVIANIQKFKLDFDDSYQFCIAQKFDLTIITFDKDFNVKGIKKNSPDEIIEQQ